MELNNMNFHPENYILLGTPRTRKADVDAIISEAKTCHPEKFEGNEDSFSFELRYTVPFDKGFKELKRLQGTAAEIAGRRNEFKGYIVINLSSWLTHHDEEYLDKALLFLVDMNDCWKYIFLVNDQNSKAARELVGKILAVFFQDHIPCEVREANIEYLNKERVNTLCREQSIICSPPVKELLQELLAQDFSESIVSAFLSEMSWNYGKKININTLVDFMTNRETVIYYMLAPKEYHRFTNIIEQRKENWYDEKETV